MHICSIETFVSGRTCVVRARTDDGLEGYGQAAPSQPVISAEVLHTLVAPHFLGQDPWALPSLVERCVRAEYKYLGTFLFRALAGVDTAIWDLQGKALQKPVYMLLGGPVRDQVRLYASSMSRETTPKEEVRRLLRAVDQHGFGCAKVKIGVRNGRDAKDGGRTSQLVPLARRELGETVELSADANGAYSPAGAVRVGRMLEGEHYYHLEEPCPCWELDNIGYVARVLDLPVGAGEQEFSLEIVRRMVAERLVDVVQPDICYMGGLTRARKVAEMADIAGMPCTPHCSNRSLVQIFTAHFVTAMPACSQFQEWSIEDQAAASGLFSPVPVPDDGAIVLDDTPGWGVEISPAFLEHAERRISQAEPGNRR